MIYVPRFTSLEVAGYSMYPGSERDPGIRRELRPGATLIVGANGLGKTTLITILRDLCAGPFRLSNRGSATAFGAGKLEVTSVDKNTFSRRVGDRGEDATARLGMNIGSVHIALERSLKDLRLHQLVVNGREVATTEDEFQSAVTAACGLVDYPDWVLLIDYLVFVTEDRVQPFWDSDVQRHLLRVLVNDPTFSEDLAEAESKHISADSEYRNARVQLNRHKRRYEELITKYAGEEDVQAQLARLDEEVQGLNSDIEDAEQALEEQRIGANSALREVELAEMNVQASVDDFEVARLRRIEAEMPTHDDVMTYLRARYSIGTLCPACGQEGGIQVKDGSCFLCGTDLPTSEDRDQVSLQSFEGKVGEAERNLEAKQRTAAEADAELTASEVGLADLMRRRSRAQSAIRALRAKLPPEAAGELTTTSTLIADLEADLASLREQLSDRRSALNSLLTSNNEAIRERQGSIKDTFDRVASEFLVESCHLVPHETRVKIGQEGERFAVQGFDIDLASATDMGETRRDTRDDVSESQRVYIDIAFRIALTRACVESGSGSLVVDAPEGALDTVYASNAARLLFEFVEVDNPSSRLVVATNLIEGSLLPQLADEAGIESALDERVIDLIEIAAPTAAVEAYGQEYRRVRDKALARKVSNE